MNALSMETIVLICFAIALTILLFFEQARHRKKLKTQEDKYSSENDSLMSMAREQVLKREKDIQDLEEKLKKTIETNEKEKDDQTTKHNQEIELLEQKIREIIETSNTEKEQLRRDFDVERQAMAEELNRHKARLDREIEAVKKTRHEMEQEAHIRADLTGKTDKELMFEACVRLQQLSNNTGFTLQKADNVLDQLSGLDRTIPEQVNTAMEEIKQNLDPVPLAEAIISSVKSELSIVDTTMKQGITQLRYWIALIRLYQRRLIVHFE